MSFKWDVPPNQAFPQLMEAYTNTIFLAGRRVAHQTAVDATAWMKEEAPWQDQTGAARAGLHVDELESPGVLTELVFSHDTSLPYVVWLEIAHAGRFAIIAPAIDFWGPKLMMQVRRIMNLQLATKG
jgi:hypothetical protein